MLCLLSFKVKKKLHGKLLKYPFVKRVTDLFPEEFPF